MPTPGGVPALIRCVRHRVDVGRDAAIDREEGFIDRVHVELVREPLQDVYG
jgi:hypothetical protein